MVTEAALTTLAKNKRWAELYNIAHKAGHEAAKASTPAPMVVTGHTNPLDDNSPVENAWYVPEGVCGFAWVVLKPGTHSFVRWLKKEGHANPEYQGGYSIWVSDYGQSMQRKEAYARAFSDTLREAFEGTNLRIYPQSRMD